MDSIFITTDSTVYGRDMTLHLVPKQIPSLQLMCLEKMMISMIQDSPQEVISVVKYLVDYDLPASIRERVLRILTQHELLSPELFDLLASAHLTNLDFTGLDLFFADENLFQNLWESNSMIKSLKFNEISHAVVQMFLRCQVFQPPTLANVLSISITNSREVTDMIVMIISQSFPNLQVLNLAECPLLTVTSLNSISTGVFVSQLLSLNISHDEASSCAIEKLSSLSNLKSLNLSFLTGDVGNFYLNLTNFSQLESLNLSSLHGLDDNGIEAMLCTSNILYKSLQSLYLTENYISDELFLRLFTASPSITPSTSLSSLYHLTHSSSLLLRTLDLSWCENITAPSLSKGLAQCPLLERLFLRATSTDVETVISIAQHCPHLIELNISRCNDITDMCLRELSTLRSLTALDISWASIQNDSTIDFLYQANTLERLSLQGCKGLQSGVVDALLDNAAKNLKFLDLGWVNMFSSVLAMDLSLARKEMIIVGTPPLYSPPPPLPLCLLTQWSRLLHASVHCWRDCRRTNLSNAHGCP
jgi:hypothetical protein